jgi:hypothetical protein
MATAAMIAAPAARDGRNRYSGIVSQPLAELPHLPPAAEQQVRSHACQLVSLAARHGITDRAFASPGRLRGHVADDRDLFDMFEFQRAAPERVQGAAAACQLGTLFSDLAVGEFADDVEVAEVAGVLLEQMEQDPLE